MSGSGKRGRPSPASEWTTSSGRTVDAPPESPTARSSAGRRTAPLGRERRLGVERRRASGRDPAVAREERAGEEGDPRERHEPEEPEDERDRPREEARPAEEPRRGPGVERAVGRAVPPELDPRAERGLDRRRAEAERMERGAAVPE